MGHHTQLLRVPWPCHVHLFSSSSSDRRCCLSLCEDRGRLPHVEHRQASYISPLIPLLIWFRNHRVLGRDNGSRGQRRMHAALSPCHPFHALDVDSGDREGSGVRGQGSPMFSSIFGLWSRSCLEGHGWVRMSGWSCYRVLGLPRKMGHSEIRGLGYHGYPGVISVAVVKYPEKKQHRGESLFSM